MSTERAATRLFRQTYGGEPAGVWAAPGRVNLIGEHTDYNAGLVLPIALPQRTYAAARRRDDDLLRLASVGQPAAAAVRLGDIAPGHPTDWSRYPAGVAWALRAAGVAIEGGVDVAFASDVPVGSGLSSSAAIEAAMGAALSDLAGLGLLADDAGRARLATYCQRAENEIAGAPTGGMDQAAALRAQERHALYLDCRDGAVTHVPFDVDAHGLRLLVIDTRAEHANADGQYGQRRADCERAAELLGLESLREIAPADLPGALARLPHERLRRRVRHVVTEIERVRQAVAALRGGDYAALGRLFVESHASLRDDFQVSCRELDLAVTTALEAGALGARMTGGGFGGSAIALVWEQALAPTKQAVTTAYTRAGFAPPAFLVAAAAGGASAV